MTLTEVDVTQVDVAARAGAGADPALRCPPWCVLHPGHGTAEPAALGAAVLHRSTESVITCRAPEVAAPDFVEVRVSRRWWIEFDETTGRWVPEPEPTVHMSPLPGFPLRSADALALSAALATAGTPTPRPPYASGRG